MGCEVLDPAVLVDSPPPEEDLDPYGINAMEETFDGPTIGRVKRTVDLNGLCVGKFVVLLAPEVDKFSFMVEGQPLWLARVRIQVVINMSCYDCEYVTHVGSATMRVHMSLTSGVLQGVVFVIPNNTIQSYCHLL